MTTGTLIVGSRIWVEVNVRVITARGRITPRLLLFLELRTPAEQIAAERTTSVSRSPAGTRSWARAG
jgi:hypothetical protein